MAIWTLVLQAYIAHCWKASNRTLLFGKLHIFKNSMFWPYESLMVGQRSKCYSWVTLLHSAAWGFSLSWAAAATKQLLSDAVFQNKQTDQVWWPPRPNCANAGVLKFGVVYSFSPLLAPWLLFFSLHFTFILSQLSNDVQIQLNL